MLLLPHLLLVLLIPHLPLVLLMPHLLLVLLMLRLLLVLLMLQQLASLQGLTYRSWRCRSWEMRSCINLLAAPATTWSLEVMPAYTSGGESCLPMVHILYLQMCRAICMILVALSLWPNSTSKYCSLARE